MEKNRKRTKHIKVRQKQGLNPRKRDLGPVAVHKREGTSLHNYKLVILRHAFSHEITYFFGFMTVYSSSFPPGSIPAASLMSPMMVFTESICPLADMADIKV